MAHQNKMRLTSTPPKTACLALLFSTSSEPLAHTFPRLTSAACIGFEFWLFSELSVSFVIGQSKYYGLHDTQACSKRRATAVPNSNESVLLHLSTAGGRQ